MGDNESYRRMLYVSELNFRLDELKEIESGVDEMELKIVYRPFGVGKLRLLVNMERSLLGFTDMGFQEQGSTWQRLFYSHCHSMPLWHCCHVDPCPRERYRWCQGSSCRYRNVNFALYFYRFGISHSIWLPRIQKWCCLLETGKAQKVRSELFLVKCSELEKSVKQWLAYRFEPLVSKWFQLSLFLFIWCMKILRSWYQYQWESAVWLKPGSFSKLYDYVDK